LAQLLLWLIISISHNACSSISLSNVLKYFKYAPKDDFNSDYIQGTMGPWYGGSLIWVINWSSGLLRLVAGRGHFCPRLPEGRTGATTQAAMEGSDCPGMPELMGLGAIGSAEDTPPSLASSTADFFNLLAEAVGLGTSSSPLDTSTSMRAFG
jgi:hypothetical protein